MDTIVRTCREGGVVGTRDEAEDKMRTYNPRDPAAAGLSPGRTRIGARREPLAGRRANRRFSDVSGG